jgi:hypothetical protein
MRVDQYISAGAQVSMRACADVSVNAMVVNNLIGKRLAAGECVNR